MKEIEIFENSILFIINGKTNKLNLCKRINQRFELINLIERKKKISKRRKTNFINLKNLGREKIDNKLNNQKTQFLANIIEEIFIRKNINYEILSKIKNTNKQIIKTF